jgi:glycosyltransferase involved in cell wall biosynthesis
MDKHDSLKIKICYLADAGSIHTQRWCKHFIQRGFEVHLISFRNIQIEGVFTHSINAGSIDVSGGNWKVLKKVPAIRRILKSIKPDILHAHYATSYGLAGALTGFHPYIITALGTDVLISPFQNWLYKLVVKYALHKADWVTAMADHMRDTIISLGVNEKKVSTVIFGIDPIIFNKEGRSVDKDTFVITSTRNFESVYNVPDLIDAISIIRVNFPNIFLNLIGTGTLLKEIENKIIKNNLQDIIKIHGRITQPEIATILKKTNVFVSVSSSDGNNISLNEAMACGCFSVVTDIPANRQWVKEGINGFFVPLNKPEAIAEQIINAYQQYEQLTEDCDAFNSKIIAEKGIWSVNMAQVEKKYLSLIKK